MRTALTAFISAASLCALATAASAQVAPAFPFPFGAPTPYPYAGSAPTLPSNTGAPLYAYHHTQARPAAVGSCSIIAGNRVCSAMPAEGVNGNGTSYGYGYGGPLGAIVGAPVQAAGAVVAAPFGTLAAPPAGTGYTGTGYTYAPATGTPAYSYESQVGPQRAAIGRCELIAGNRVCLAGP
jgi:hypothetical protein